MTDLENTICYPEESLRDTVCPITDIKIIENSAVSDSEYTSKNYQTAGSFNATTTVIYSRDTNNLPITTTKVEQRPCMDSLY